MSGFTITVFSADGVVTTDNVDPLDISEELRVIGLGWQTPDWTHDQQVQITITPRDEKTLLVRENVRVPTV